MPLVVVGSIAYDSIKTPHGEAQDTLGGSAVYFSLAASTFTQVRLVGVVGADFRPSDTEFLAGRDIDTQGMETVSGGETFRWSGEYSPDMNDRETLSVDLNVFEDFQPKLPASYRDSRFVFLANGSPLTQISVLDQVDSAEFVMADSMDLWIQTQRDELLALLERIDGLLVNDSEALLLTQQHNIIDAGRKILELGPSLVVVKKGEHGAILFRGDEIVSLPAFPTSRVLDPTGAGDSFAGALMGHIAARGEVSPDVVKEAVAHGVVAASFTVEDFGVASIAGLDRKAAQSRFDEYRSMLTL